MSALPAVLTALLLVALPIDGAEGPRKVAVTLVEEATVDVGKASAVPEPSSIVFVGIGALILLAFTMRRK